MWAGKWTIMQEGFYISSWTVYASWSSYCILQLFQKTFYCNDNKTTEFENIDSKHSSSASVIFYELIDLWVLDSNGSLIAPMALEHSLHPINNMWVGRCVSPWWSLFSSRKSVLIYIYICLYVCILKTSSGYRAYIYRRMECRSVLVKLHPITFYRTGFRECAIFVLNATSFFLWFHQLCLALW